MGAVWLPVALLTALTFCSGSKRARNNYETAVPVLIHVRDEHYLPNRDKELGPLLSRVGRNGLIDYIAGELCKNMAGYVSETLEL